MNKYHQKGSLVIYVAVIVAVLGAIFALYSGYSSMNDTIKLLSGEKSRLEESLSTANENISKLTLSNESLVKQIAVLTDINVENDRIRKENSDKIRDLQTKLDKANQKLPTILSNDKVCPATKEEQDNSAQRLKIIWELYNHGRHSLDAVLLGNETQPEGVVQ